MKLFGTDGVRGKAGGDITASVVLKLAMAAGIYFKASAQTNRIIIGKDTRKSGYMIENAITSGLIAVGYDVKLVGPIPTPAVAFLSENMRCDAGIMISASHNPYYDNGIKFFDALGNKLDNDAEKEIEKIFCDDDLIKKHQEQDTKIGHAERIEDALGRYIVHIKNSFPTELNLKGLRVVVDAANGSAYKVAPTILHELGADVVALNDEPDGTNINLNSGAMNPESLCEAVREYRADIGFAFDGDADRLVVVDENSHIVDGDKLIGALACYLKSCDGLKNSAISATVMSNMALKDFLQTRGIDLFRCDVGDKHVLKTLQKENLNFGGEQSGHIIFADFSKTGDGIVSALQVLAYMITSNKKASEILNPFELYPQLQKNIIVCKKTSLDEIDGYKELIDELHNQGINEVIRYSGTENLLRVLLEGKDKQTLTKYMNKCTNFFNKCFA